MDALRPRLLIAFAAAALLPPVLKAADAVPGGKVDFNYDIRPIISAKCFHCHGPDESSRKAHLRLDSREEAMKKHDDLQAIVPGDLDNSELVARIMSTDPDEMMPPPKENKKLTAAEITLLKRWVTEGAEYKPHWSFTKPERPAIPSIADNGFKAADWPQGTHPENWSRNPIDAFVLTKMAKAGLKPSPEAEPHLLCRRLYLDIIGLPPTPDEVDAFVQATARNRDAAVNQLVDQLLASPRFGEKWARMWLDLARYADSTGYGSDKFRLNIWPWRDWVIQAFNRDLPYDQFTKEQIAGDLLPDATTEQIEATAFNRNTMTNVEGGIVPEEYRVAAVKDRVSTTCQVWMGLTMGCAQCHSHKFDPIAQKEYYQMFAVFNQTADANRGDEEPTMPVPTIAEQAKREKITSEIAALENKLAEAQPAIDAEQRAWEARARQPIGWQVLPPSEATSTDSSKLTVNTDGSILAEGGTGMEAVYTIKTLTNLKGITAFRLEALPDESLPAKGPGRASDGNAVVNEIRVVAGPAESKPPLGRFVRIEAPGKGRILSLAEVQVFHGAENVALKGTATQSSTDFEGPAKLAIDGNTNGEYAQSHSVTHTKTSDNPWWEVDLGAETEINRIIIWNRTDGDHGTRLSNSRIIVLDAARKPLVEMAIAAAPKDSEEFTPSAGVQAVALQNASADFSQQGFSVDRAIDGDSNHGSGWAFLPQAGTAHTAVFETAKPVGNGATLLTFRIEQTYGQNHTLGRFRISATTKTKPVRELPGSIGTILAIDEARRTPAQRSELAAFYRPLSAAYVSLSKEIEAAKNELAAIKPITVPVMRELAEGKRRTSHLLNKGNYLAPGDVVEPGLPAAFAGWFKSDRPIDRLAVAQWLTSPENPLTARVAVNRFWAQLFGLGIVETEEDFGTQGALPTHPDLLDWLAVSFESPKNSAPAQFGLGWDMKALVRVIVTSATYRQSSRITPEAQEKDSRDRYLSHYPRRRIDAETVRDQALALAGLLSPKIGGPSVYPPQPPGLWQVAFNGGQNGYPTSTGEDRYRRGLYTFWRRTKPYPSMATFDAPSREACTLRRLPTNTPLQAFVTLNDPCFVECAQALARRIACDGGATPEQRIRWALKLVQGRPATDDQTATLRKLYDEELATYRADAASAKKLAGSETQPLPKDADPAELAAWTVVANVLLNLDGVLTKS